jgi:hypothetical protein
MGERCHYWSKSQDCQSPIDPEANMIQVTPRAAAYIAARGGHLTLYARTLAG